MEEKVSWPVKYYKTLPQTEHLAGNGYLNFEKIEFVQSTTFDVKTEMSYLTFIQIQFNV